MEGKFLAFAFIIVLVVVLVADSMATAALVLSLLANFISLGNHFSRIGGKEPEHFEPGVAPVLAQDGDYEDHYNYVLPFQTYDADDRMAFVGKCGGRNAKAQIDGLVSKDKDFYQYYWGNELALAENREWWGMNDH